MQIFCQVLSIIVEVIAAMQKKKNVAMLLYILDNAIFVAMFFSFGKTTTAYICVVATVKSILYFIFAQKKIKPNIFVLIGIEIAYIVIAIITWTEPLDLLILIASVFTAYTSWQDNMALLRFGLIVNPALYFIYKSIIGAYISLISEAILLLSNLFALIYYDILKKEKPIMECFKFGKKKQKKQGGIQKINTEKEQEVLND